MDFDSAKSDVDSILGPGSPQLAPLCVCVRRAKPPDRNRAARILPRDTQISAIPGTARRGARRPQTNLRHQQTKEPSRVLRKFLKL